MMIKLNMIKELIKVMSCEDSKIHICNCPFDCDNHGACCACLYHHISRNEFPSCFFKSAKSLNKCDRSLEALVKEKKDEIMQILKNKKYNKE